MNDYLMSIIITFYVLIRVLLWYLNRKNFQYKMGEYPGPPPLPLVGNALDFKDKTKILSTLREYQKLYGNTFKIEIGINSYLLLADPDMVQFLLSSNKLIEKSQEYRFGNRWLGNGLLTSAGDLWKTHRKLITPAFHFKTLDKFIKDFDRCSDILVDKLKLETKKPETDIYPFITLCTLDVICESVMGTSMNAQHNSDSSYVQAVRNMGMILSNRIFSAVKQIDFLYGFTNDAKLEKESLEIIHSTTKKVILERKEILQGNKKSKNCGNTLFLDLLLETHLKDSSFTVENIQNQVDTFMFEGHDTTASAISFTLYCIANNPEVQAKVLDEIDTIFNAQIVTHENLQAMTYLEKVIKESLRLYPVVPMYGRKITEDVEYNDKIIPEGITVAVFAYGLHRNPKIFPDPDKFDPERFNSNVERSPFSYVPFSAGPRNCIGQKFAIFEMKCIISKILRNFELKAVDRELILSSESIMKTADGVWIKLIDRKN